MAIVTPRFGDEVVGGSERFVSSVAIALANNINIDIITTTAKYETWKPFYPEGVSKYSDNINIVRFNNDNESWYNLPKSARGNPWQGYNMPIPTGFVSDIIRDNKQECLVNIKNSALFSSDSFIRGQGPQSIKLFDYLYTNSNKWHKVLFMPYLHATTLIGSRMIPSKKVVIMLAAHNETQIYFPIYKEYSNYRWGVFYEREKDMFAGSTGIYPENGFSVVTPMPLVSSVIKPNPGYRNSIVFVGRASEGKCTNRLIESIEIVKNLTNNKLIKDIKLELVGVVGDSIKQMISSRKDWIIEHGNVPMRTRDEIVNGCMMLCSPSLLDSMGLVNLEAMFCGTPVLVNTDCPAFLDLCTISEGKVLGFSIYDPASLARAIDALSDQATRMKVAIESQVWALERYNETSFMNSIRELLEI